MSRMGIDILVIQIIIIFTCKKCISNPLPNAEEGNIRDAYNLFERECKLKWTPHILE